MKEEKDVAPMDFTEYLSLLKWKMLLYELVKVDKMYNISKSVLATV